ncbi:glycosyltransferase family protein [Synechocystis sp. PCC 7509]|uniref:glycosyltransferase family protein n=1 Tax=Synechocystis sp. PCC 7509 TaxID=927677 RepID=UPI0002ACED58|nr:glycosyltransferase [Synechocystis sp. PCC 7509]
MKIMVYSHDTFGLGNINRMLAICKHLLTSIPNLSILLVSGSPMLQSFRMLKGLDYIKLPCLNRGEHGELAAKYLGTDIEETVKLRTDLILSATANFKPDLVIVDKKPYGLKHELTATLNYLRSHLLQTKLVLLLRDILDSPDKTIEEWQKHSYYQAIEQFYDRVLIVGTPEIFDTAKEYNFPPAVTQKVQYCGYTRRPPGVKSKNSIREELQVLPHERLVLVTPGGGEDGYELVEAYLSGLALLPKPYQFKSLIICGPEMPLKQKQQVELAAKAHSQVQIGEFTDDLMSYIQAADTVVSMAGYNTICEILSAGTPAVVIPRAKPSLEQTIRAEKMANLGLFKAIDPENIEPANLIEALLSQLAEPQHQPSYKLDMNALTHVADNIFSLLAQTTCQRKLSNLYQKLVNTNTLGQQKQLLTHN